MNAIKRVSLWEALFLWHFAGDKQEIVDIGRMLVHNNGNSKMHW